MRLTFLYGNIRKAVYCSVAQRQIKNKTLPKNVYHVFYVLWFYQCCLATNNLGTF